MSTACARRAGLIGRAKSEIETPALIIDAAAFEANLQRGQDDFRTASVSYRPHSKSHKSPIIARKQLAAGATGICCAKLSEAEVMIESGITDILVTTPVVEASKIERLVATAAAGAAISVVVDDRENIVALADAATRARAHVGLVIELDVGQGRCGVRSPGEVLGLARQIVESDHLQFVGLQGYHGSIQTMASFAQRELAVREALNVLLQAAEIIRAEGIPVGVLTGGGTGSSMIDTALGGLNEIQPGSYVFMDTQYLRVEREDCAAGPWFLAALTLLGTVISRPSDEQAILDIGLKAASMDGGVPETTSAESAVFTFAGDEHGALRFAQSGRAPRVGSKVELYPSHCDTTVNLFNEYVVVRDGAVEDIWPIEGRGKTQ
jgi:D-serine deaminase-like pyridoxal phosphate-dependent protein